MKQAAQKIEAVKLGSARWWEQRYNNEYAYSAKIKAKNAELLAALNKVALTNCADASPIREFVSTFLVKAGAL